MRLLHSASRTHASFDDPNLVSCAGLVPVMRLAGVCGLHTLVARLVRLGTSVGSNPAGKITSVVAGMVAGADCIDDLDVIRHGGMGALSGGAYAPSTLGSFLREFTFGHVRQLGAAARRFVVELAGATPLLPGAEAVTFVDVDSLLRRVYGRAKQGAGFGHAKVGGYGVLLRGLSPLIATLSTPVAAPVIAAARLRGGSAGSVRGAASLVAEALGVARQVGAVGLVLLRADSAYYTAKVIAAARRAGARFSITVASNRSVRAAIAAIAEDAWTPIRYPQAIWDDQSDCWISDAQVAETTYTAFAGTRYEITARLVVRRVHRDNPTGQGELLPGFRYHAFFTDTTFSTVDADLTHRAHAVIEQVFADLIEGPLVHLPSGRFGANGAWLIRATIAHNLLRAAGTLTSRTHGKARAATLRRQIINVPAQLAHRAEGIVMHLPTHWPWATRWQSLFQATSRPAPAAPI
ncbi:MAG: IS1380 family transposase [Pseudonocardiaceae bacterium]